MTCRFLPPYLLERLAAAHVDDHVCRCGRHTLDIDASLRFRRQVPPRVAGAPLEGLPATHGPLAVYSAGNAATLPGTLVRAYGDPPTGDQATDEAYAGGEAVLDLFAEVYDRASYDGRGAPVIATVHYEQGYDNAFWDGHQLVFGDGDGRVFDRFTKPVDVLGHEFAHAVIQHTAGLVYVDQPGALNESLSDVFASCLKQRLRGQTAAEADWMIGEGLFLPGVRARALRSMAEPGTAYDDPVLGRDPQVGSMADYVDSERDNRGVHLNSGIPNRAFYLAATALGGTSWETAGRIWYAALTSGIGAGTDFAGFAQACVTAAERHLPASVSAVREAWDRVGVPVGAVSRSVPDRAPVPATDGSVVAVTRSGGFAGLEVSGQLVLGEDARSAEVESLLGRIDLLTVAESPPLPDRFVYDFRLPAGRRRVGEGDLTPELHRLAGLVLGE